MLTLNDTADRTSLEEIQEKSTLGKIENLKITGLESQKAYIFKVGVYTRFGKCAESVASEMIYTKPCPAGMFHVTKNRCEFCPRGKFSAVEKSQV